MYLCNTRPVRYIIPTQHVMEKVYSLLSTKYVPSDVLLIVYLKYHRDVMNQTGTIQVLDLYDEYADDLWSLVVKYNREKPFADLLDSTDDHSVVMGYQQVTAIAKDLFNRLKETERLLGEILSRTLPDAFYNYQCEPVEVRLYAGDLVIKFMPLKSIGVIDAAP